MKLSLKKILKESEQEPKDLEEKEFWEDWNKMKDKVGALKTKLFHYDSIVDKYSSDERSVTFSEIYQTLHDEKGLDHLKKQIDDLTQQIANAMRWGQPGFAKDFDLDKYEELVTIKTHKRNEHDSKTAKLRSQAEKIYDDFMDTRKAIFRIMNSFSSVSNNPADLLNKYLDHVDDYDTAYEMATILLNAISLMSSELHISFSSLAKPLSRFLEDNF